MYLLNYIVIIISLYSQYGVKTNQSLFSESVFFLFFIIKYSIHVLKEKHAGRNIALANTIVFFTQPFVRRRQIIFHVKVVRKNGNMEEENPSELLVYIKGSGMGADGKMIVLIL